MRFTSVPKQIEAVQFAPVDGKPNISCVKADTNSETGWSVYNTLHNSTIKIKVGDWVRIDIVGDNYPIDNEYMQKNYIPTNA